MNNLNIVGPGAKTSKVAFGKTNEQADELISALRDWLIDDTNIRIIVGHRVLGDENTAEVFFVLPGAEGTWFTSQWQFAKAAGGVICRKAFDLDGSETEGVTQESAFKCPWRPAPESLVKLIGNIGVPWVDRQDVIWMERDLDLFVALFGKEDKE